MQRLSRSSTMSALIKGRAGLFPGSADASSVSRLGPCRHLPACRINPRMYPRFVPRASYLASNQKVEQILTEEVRRQFQSLRNDMAELLKKVPKGPEKGRVVRYIIRVLEVISASLASTGGMLIIAQTFGVDIKAVVGGQIIEAGVVDQTVERTAAEKIENETKVGKVDQSHSPQIHIANVEKVIAFDGPRAVVITGSVILNIVLLVLIFKPGN